MAIILVTGSRGTLGRPLVTALKADGHEVWECDLQHHEGEQYIRADISDFRQTERVFTTTAYDCVYHLAAEFGRLNGEEYYETLWRTNAIGTRHILEWQRRYQFRLIFSSSSEVYGETGEDWLMEELTDTRAIVQPNDYAVTKWVNEIQIMNAEKRHNAQCMRLRLFNAYGPGEHYHNYRSVVCLFIYRALHGIPFQVYKNYHRVFMYVDDLIPTMVAASRHFLPGRVLNIGGREYRSVEELAELVLEHTGASRSLMQLVGEDRHNVRNKRPNITNAITYLGHNPCITLEEGIPLTVEWMKSQ